MYQMALSSRPAWCTELVHCAWLKQHKVQHHKLCSMTQSSGGQAGETSCHRLHHDPRCPGPSSSPTPPVFRLDRRVHHAITTYLVSHGHGNFSMYVCAHVLWGVWSCELATTVYAMRPLPPLSVAFFFLWKCFLNLVFLPRYDKTS